MSRRTPRQTTALELELRSAPLLALPDAALTLAPILPPLALTIEQRQAACQALQAALLPAFNDAVAKLMDGWLAAQGVMVAAKVTEAIEVAVSQAQADAVAQVEAERLVTPKDAAAMLGVSPATLKRYVVKGQLPKPVKLGVRSVRHRLSDIRAAMSAGLGKAVVAKAA